MRFDYFEQFYENLKEDFERLGFTKDVVREVYNTNLAQFKYNSKSDEFIDVKNDRVYRKISFPTGIMYKPKDIDHLNDGDILTFFKKSDTNYAYTTKVDGNDMIIYAKSQFFVEDYNVKDFFYFAYTDVVPFIREQGIALNIYDFCDYLNNNKIMPDIDINISCFNPDDLNKHLEANKNIDIDEYIERVKNVNKIKVIQDGKIIEKQTNYPIDYNKFLSHCLGVAENYYQEYKNKQNKALL